MDEIKRKSIEDKLDLLIKKQIGFHEEINELKREIQALKATTPIDEAAISKVTKTIDPKDEKIITLETREEQTTSSTTIADSEFVSPISKKSSENIGQTNQIQNADKQLHKVKDSFKTAWYEEINKDFEKFVGENLINKIGIIITVIGVAIGAKYSIDHNLISPLTRVILGYLLGLALMGFGIKLKKNYHNFSSVLVAGAIAILYLITFAAYNYYGLMPQTLAFVMMAIFTAFGVLTAVHYDKQIIAHIGLVGAYAVPFLLSDGSGKVAVMFGYMAIINLGILFIAFKKYWKPLYYSAFVMTWLIYLSWAALDYNREKHFMLAMSFAFIFFILFYMLFLAYKVIRKEVFLKFDVVMLLINSFLFYGIGYLFIGGEKNGEEYLGLFTLANAIIHFGVCTYIYKQNLADKNIFYLIAGLVLVFITIAIPVQLEGNWVTIAWALLAALLFWIGRSKGVSFYENLSMPLILLSFFSLIHDWGSASLFYNDTSPKYSPIINEVFLGAVIVLGCLFFIYTFSRNPKYELSVTRHSIINHFFNIAVPALFILCLFYSFKHELSMYFDSKYQLSALNVKQDDATYTFTEHNYDILYYKNIWINNYSLLFFGLLTLLNIYRLKNHQLGYVNLILNILFIGLFLSSSLLIFSELRESYLIPEANQLYQRTSMNINIRYLSFIFIAFNFYCTYKYIRQEFMKSLPKFTSTLFELILAIAVVWILSSELLSWLDVLKYDNKYKLGLSILWGICSLLMIVIGIWKNKKHLRIAAIALFAITLIKLFLYDISHIDTISKVIIFVSLGLLLLIISFLYNKYKHQINITEDV